MFLPFVTALVYVPLRDINVQHVTARLTVRYEREEEAEQVNIEDNYVEETVPDDRNIEIKCYDLSKRGYIGVPRAWAFENLALRRFVDLTVKPKRQPELFPRQIRPRDNEQREFMDLLCGICRGPFPVDAVANARTGTGKTVSALYMAENGVQAPTLVTVPTNYLLNQWRTRIGDLMGGAFFDKYVGHIQQDRMNYRGKLITLGLAPSLARRNYPEELRRYFAAIFFDEWHKIGTPSMNAILTKYPASIRVGFTATNRRDAFLKVCTLHLGKPRIISKQRVMEPQVFVVDYEKTLPPRMTVASPRHMITILSRLHDRNQLLADLIYHYGYERGRNCLFLSDRTDQLQAIISTLRRMGVDGGRVGLLVGQYNSGGRKVKMSRDEQQWVADNCQLIGATYGIFDTGADVDRLDMGVECTPRINLRQALGRILRIKPGKPTPEWYSIRDTINVYPPDVDTSSLFMSTAQVRPQPYQSLLDDARAREASYRDQRGTISVL